MRDFRPETHRIGSSIGFLNHASRNYFWSHRDILLQPAFSFRSRLLKSTLLQRTAMFQVMNYVLTWPCSVVNDLLSKTKTNIYLSRSKRVSSYILNFCDSLTIPHVLVLCRIAPSKWSLFRSRPRIFIPRSALKISVIPHPVSTLIFIPHLANFMSDPHKSLHFHFVSNCYHPLYFRTKKLLTNSSKWQYFHWCVPHQSRWK